MDKSLTVSDRFDFKSQCCHSYWRYVPKALWVLQVHTCCYRCQNFILFYGWVVFHCLYIPHLYLSSVDENLGCFHILAIVNNASVNIGMHVFFQISVFAFFGYIYPEVELMGHMVVLLLVFLRNLHTVFLSIYINIHSHQQYTRIPLSPHPQQYLLFVFSLMIVILTHVRWYLIVVWTCILSIVIVKYLSASSEIGIICESDSVVCLYSYPSLYYFGVSHLLICICWTGAFQVFKW